MNWYRCLTERNFEVVDDLSEFSSEVWSENHAEFGSCAKCLRLVGWKQLPKREKVNFLLQPIDKCLVIYI